MIPAVLTAYCDEFGDANLMMHILDFTEMTGGDIEWCHYVGVKWRGGSSLALYGRKNEDWRVQLMVEIPLSAEDLTNLVTQRFMFGEDSFVSDSQRVASVMLPFLPLANRLQIWDKKTKLDCLESDIDELRESEMIKFVIDREVIPLSETQIIAEPWYELDTFTSPLSEHPRLIDENFFRGILREL